MKFKSTDSLFIFLTGLVIGTIVLATFSWAWSEIPMIRAPECQAHVKVVDRRTEETTVYDAATDHFEERYSYYATFEFPDGSKKEFGISAAAKSDIWLWSTGTITYKETAENGRRIISYEKDPEYGGTKVTVNHSYTMKTLFIGIGIITLLICGVIIWFKSILESLKKR